MPRKVQREHRRKMIYCVKLQEERQKKLKEEEEVRQREEAERRRKEEAELKAKQDEIFAKQKQRENELEEKKRQQRGGFRKIYCCCLGTETPVVSRAAEGGLASASTTGKYVPKFKLRASTEGAAPPQPQAPCPAETDRWGSRADDRAPQHTDRWGRDDRRPSSFGSSGASRPTWQPPRAHGER